MNEALFEGTLNPRRGLNRRSMLRAAGVAMGLPLLDSMRFTAARAAPKPVGPGASGRRLVAVSYNLGFHPPSFFPENTGLDYTPSEYLKVLEPLKKDFTVVSGTSHLDVRGGHEVEGCFLTAAPYPRSPFKQTISMDQMLAAEMIGTTREPYLVLGASNKPGVGVMTPGISYGRGGTPVPGITSPSALFTRLFLDTGNAAAQKDKLARGQSILDSVKAQSEKLRRDIGPDDRDKLAEYMDSVRDLEMKMTAAKTWADTPKPKPGVKAPIDDKEPSHIIERMRLMYDMIHLALQTDSTRVISMYVVDGGTAPTVPGVTTEHHDLTHHGKVEEKIAQLRKHELAEMVVIHEFLAKLKATKDGDSTLLDKTSVLIGCHMGEAARHNSQNLPIIVAGGGFKHAGHLAFDKVNNRPLGNLFVSLMQCMGMNIDQFGTTKGTLTGLEWA